jgi:Dyp-type peroxidase family
MAEKALSTSREAAQSVEIEDVQGIVLRGYGKLEGACFLALRFEDATRTRAWLRTILTEVTPASAEPGAEHLNLAFTYGALQRLGLHPDALASFSLAFSEGIAGERRGKDGEQLSHRSEILGDVRSSAPEKWRWGNEQEPVDLALLLYTGTLAGLEPFVERQRERLTEHDLEIVYEQETTELFGRKEHFGFRDGISQPNLRNRNDVDRRPGVLADGPPRNTVEPGEFLLGYRNHYSHVSDSPTLPASEDPDRILAALPGQRERRDFGRNGSFLVWRELTQHVKKFWEFIDDHSEDDPLERRKLAAKLVGRWPSGAPLLLRPTADDPTLEDANDFGYLDRDPHGFQVPFGSHIRRANPRDWLLSPKPIKATLISNRHRIIRRARPYGDPLHCRLDPEGMLAAKEDDAPRGLQFLAFMVDIERQFEFIQQNWLGNPKFADLYDEQDPVLGAQPEEGGSFTLQASPLRERLSGLTRFVDVRGGGYFLMPGLRALRYLASLK